MKRIATNALTGWALAIVAGFWLVSLFVSGFWLAIGVRLGLFFAGVAALWEWGPSAFNILRERKAPTDGRGELLSLLGIATISTGVVYSSVWGILWYAVGTPTSWIATGHSMFGNFLLAVGLALVYRSTDIKRDVVRPLNWWFVIAVMVFVAVAGFLLGTKVASEESIAAIRLAERQCPVAISNRGIYHTPDSPYRSWVALDDCVDSVEEALARGARAPG